MLIALIVLSIVALVSVAINLALLNRLLEAAKIAPIELPRLTKKVDDPPVVEERRRVFTMPIEG